MKPQYFALALVLIGAGLCIAGVRFGGGGASTIGGVLAIIGLLRLC